MSRTISRRSVIQSGLAGAALAALSTPALSKAGGRPNILFVPIDDMNDWTGWLGGYPGVRTPNFDRLVRMGLGCERAYTPVPVCLAARAAILFAREPHKSGLYTNGDVDWTETELRDRPSLIRTFKENGYETIGTGKTFHSGWRINDEGNDPGAWTEYEAFRDASDSGGDDYALSGPKGSVDSAEDMQRARWLARTVLSKRRDRRFFASFGIRKPHLPWRVPQRYFDMYPLKSVRYPLGALDTEHVAVSRNKDAKDLPRAGLKMLDQFGRDHRRIIAGEGWKAQIQAYLACISQADAALGVVLDAVLKGPNASNTVIVVWSDHGWQLGEKLAWRKFTLWERATHVPLAFAGHDIPARRSKALVSTIDLYRTLGGLARIDLPGQLDGEDLSAFVRGREETTRPVARSAWGLSVPGNDRWRNDVHFAVRNQDYRLIAYGNGERELYDHRTDPWEWRNIAEEEASRDVIKRLEERLPEDPVRPRTASERRRED